VFDSGHKDLRTKRQFITVGKMASYLPLYRLGLMTAITLLILPVENLIINCHKEKNKKPDTFSNIWLPQLL
jgi:hypothetical protein